MQQKERTYRCIRPFNLDVDQGHGHASNFKMLLPIDEAGQRHGDASALAEGVSLAPAAPPPPLRPPFRLGERCFPMDPAPNDLEPTVFEVPFNARGPKPEWSVSSLQSDHIRGPLEYFKRPWKLHIKK